MDGEEKATGMNKQKKVCMEDANEETMGEGSQGRNGLQILESKKKEKNNCITYLKQSKPPKVQLNRLPVSCHMKR